MQTLGPDEMETIVIAGMPLILFALHTTRVIRKWALIVSILAYVAAAWHITISSIYVSNELYCAAAEARGDYDTAIGDTGTNVAALVMGWFPPTFWCIVSGLPFWIVHRIRIDRRKKTQRIDLTFHNAVLK